MFTDPVVPVGPSTVKVRRLLSGSNLNSRMVELEFMVNMLLSGFSGLSGIMARFIVFSLRAVVWVASTVALIR